MKEALLDMVLFREVAGLDIGGERLPDKNTFQRFRHLLEGSELHIGVLAAVKGWRAEPWRSRCGHDGAQNRPRGWQLPATRPGNGRVHSWQTIPARRHRQRNGQAPAEFTP